MAAKMAARISKFEGGKQSEQCFLLKTGHQNGRQDLYDAIS
jgi:hypothetical protein